MLGKLNIIDLIPMQPLIDKYHIGYI